MKLYNKSTVRIHSEFTDIAIYAKDGTHGHSAVSLYYFCRGLDVKIDGEGKVEQEGCGKVIFNINDAAICLGKKISTIKDYLVNGVKLGFFRYYRRVGNTVTVYYASLYSIAVRYGIERLGVVAETPLTELKHLKYWGTQLVAQQLQGSSRYLAQKELPKGAKIAQPEDILTTPANIQKPQKGKSPNTAKPRKRNTEVCSDEEQKQWFIE